MRKLKRYKDGGPKVKQRRGVRKNYDNKAWTPSGLQFPTSESSHLMKAEYIPERGWVAFPSLFQDSKPYANDQQNWVDMSEEEDWMKIYEEAERRGEVYDFGEDKEAALAFGKGSWKDQLLDEGMEVELTEEEADKYRAGGYILEEMHEGGEPHSHPHEDELLVKGKRKDYDRRGNLLEKPKTKGTIFVTDPNDPRIKDYRKRKKLYEHSKDVWFGNTRQSQ